MTKKDKLLDRLKSLPKDFTVDELTVLLMRMGFSVSQKGFTSGSRMAYINSENGDIIRIHKPHPGKIIGPATLKDVLIFLNEKGYVTKD